MGTKASAPTRDSSISTTAKPTGNVPVPEQDPLEANIRGHRKTFEDVPSNKTAGYEWEVFALSWPGQPREGRVHGAMRKRALETMMGLAKGTLTQIVDHAKGTRTLDGEVFGKVRITFKGRNGDPLERNWTASTRIRPARVGGGSFKKEVVLTPSAVVKLEDAYKDVLFDMYS